MRLEKIVVSNYKSLKNVTLNLGKFNVLIGPNNSGKTNFLDCLSFLSEFTTGQMNVIQRIRGGYDHIIFGGNTKENIEIRTYFASEEGKFEYNITFEENRIISESLYVDKKIIANHNDTNVTLFTASGDKIDKKNWANNISFFRLLEQKKIELAVSPKIIDVFNYFKSWRFYNIIPSLIRRKDDVKHEYDIGADGSKSALVLHTLLSQHLPIFMEVQKTLKSCIKEIDRLLSPTTKNGETYIALKEKWFDNPFDYHQLSDGTLCLIAHLLIIYSPPKKGLITIEEPEDYIHPKLLKTILDIMRAADTQTIMITHSPFFIDNIKPEELIIATKKEGQTIFNKGPSKNEIEKLKFSLGELWFSGELTDES